MSSRDTDGLLTDVFIDILLLDWAVTPLLSDKLATVFIVVIVLIGALFFMRRVEAAAGKFADWWCARVPRLFACNAFYVALISATGLAANVVCGGVYQSVFWGVVTAVCAVSVFRRLRRPGGRSEDACGRMS